jgi:hypothetical protein
MLYKYRMKNCLILLLSLITMQIQGQSLRFSVFQGLGVKQNGMNLPNPWAGGMNAMQFQSMDLNSDGILDLVLFDRTSQQISTFLQDRLGSFVFSPQYISKFPRIENWFVLVDYNRDGRKDLFCSTEAGIKVFEYKLANGQFSFELVKDPLFSLGFSGLINLYVASPDIPVVADVDDDGDVDVLAFEPGGHYIEFHENVSIQKSGKPGLDFVKSAQNWGNILHSDCKDTKILDMRLSTQSIDQINRVSHVGNSLGRTSRNDLFFGHVSCTNLTLLTNKGTNQSVNYSKIEYDYLGGFKLPTGLFWSASPMKIQGDAEEVFISVNTSDNVGFSQDFQHSSFRMNGGQVKPFLQDQMIDVGEKASPCFFDVDADGDLDLLIGHAGVRKSNDVFSSIYLYENQSGVLVFKTADYLGLGTRESLVDLVLQPQGNQIIITGLSINGTKAFKLLNQQLSTYQFDLNFGEIPISSPFGNLIQTRIGRIQSKLHADWGQLSKESWQLRTCQFADLDGDGLTEFIGIDVTGMWHVGNYDVTNNTLIWRIVDFQGFTVGRNARLSVADFNSDGRMDLIVGTGAGGVYLLANQSTSPIWDAIETQALQVWPNPSSGVLNVLANKTGELQLLNIWGQLLLKVAIQPGKTYNFIDTSTSFIRFIDAFGNVTTRKIQSN